MSFNKIEETTFASPQITTADIDRAIAQGVKVIINNRPDYEEGGQPLNADLQSYAEEKGLTWHHIPLVGGNLSEEHITLSVAAFKESAPTLAFCRSGTRSTMLWGLAMAATHALSTDEILEKASGAGYDFAMQRGLFEQVRNLHP
ncbi:TIGR01244 family sulfur transferase [Temperatibacter marinus]|uniref:TIGR01244 family sulfur transferase n=1 Tax=Temperatibacter marinus TaxID=1456591 RepID=A0AA52EHU4_9PROT|nr:TIGR01244 family sulfur transferase [Temperatibacter marinus]WND03055.1 TIGR01244 family sulfur transferase [Temperatibacter marinus]